jgi:hypothetical protein
MKQNQLKKHMETTQKAPLTGGAFFMPERRFHVFCDSLLLIFRLITLSCICIFGGNKQAAIYAICTIYNPIFTNRLDEK